MKTLGLVAVATLMGAAAPAFAGEPSTLVVQGSRVLSDNQRAVSYADLQLASSQDRAVLRNRVAMAIADMCDPKRFSVAEPHDAMKCSAEAWASVAPRLDQLSPRLASR